ncbi:MAG: hypothetical protein U0793_16560 [Gemmataceae bacterium]
MRRALADVFEPLDAAGTRGVLPVQEEAEDGQAGDVGEAEAVRDRLSELDVGRARADADIRRPVRGQGAAEREAGDAAAASQGRRRNNRTHDPPDDGVAMLLGRGHGRAHGGLVNFPEGKFTTSTRFTGLETATPRGTCSPTTTTWLFILPYLHDRPMSLNRHPTASTARTSSNAAWQKLPD